jgi:hypothetical protein
MLDSLNSLLHKTANTFLERELERQIRETNVSGRNIWSELTFRPDKIVLVLRTVHPDFCMVYGASITDKRGKRYDTYQMSVDYESSVAENGSMSIRKKRMVNRWEYQICHDDEDTLASIHNAFRQLISDIIAKVTADHYKYLEKLIAEYSLEDE